MKKNPASQLIKNRLKRISNILLIFYCFIFLNTLQFFNIHSGLSEFNNYNILSHHHTYDHFLMKEYIENQTPEFDMGPLLILENIQQIKNPVYFRIINSIWQPPELILV